MSTTSLQAAVHLWHWLRALLTKKKKNSKEDLDWNWAGSKLGPSVVPDACHPLLTVTEVKNCWNFVSIEHMLL